MGCIKTGARVLLKNYDCVVAADLHEVNGAVLVRFNPQSNDWSPAAIADADYTAIIPEGGQNHYYNEQTGHLMVPSCYVVRLK